MALRFDLRTAFAIVSVCCLWSALFARWGALVLSLTMALVVFALVALIWGLLYWRAPSLTLHASVFLFCALLVLPLVPCYILRSRAEAQKIRAGYGLIHIIPSDPHDRPYLETAHGMAFYQNPLLGASATSIDDP
jgi:hypothetical protein